MHPRQAGVTGQIEASTAPEGANDRMRKLADLADDLVEQLEVVGDQYEQLQRTLDEPTLPGDGTGPPVLRAAEELPAEDDGIAYGPSTSDSVRLVVMDMAIKGSSREQTKAYVREVFGLDDGDAIVDEIFDTTEAAQGAAHRRRLFTRHA
jgi:hypothetical protein